MIESLNIGCGGAKTKPHAAGNKQVNIDLIAGGVRADALALPFRSESFDTAKAIHVLEHITRDEQRFFLMEAHRVLRPGGILYVEVPNLLEVCRKLVKAGDEINTLVWNEPGPEYTRFDRVAERVRVDTLSVYGKYRHVGDSHCWGFMPHSLTSLLNTYGFDKVELFLGSPEVRDNMISDHYTMEPVILAKAYKVKSV